MKVEQALIAVGGRASRLKGGGIEVPITKSFLEVEGKPLLLWSLTSLCLAGVKRVVLVGDKREHLQHASRIVDDLPNSLDEVRYFQDKGLGVHGLPYHTRHLLEEGFFFECGHGISKPSHYVAMDSLKRSDNVVFSAFRAHPSNPRQPVILEEARVARLAKPDERTGIALAHPLLVDQVYAEKLPSLGFDITKIIGHYTRTSQLECVTSDMPPEFDIADELREAQGVYSVYFNKVKVNKG